MMNHIFATILLFTAYNSKSPSTLNEKLTTVAANNETLEPNESGFLSYTINGKTYKNTDKIFTVIIQGKIGDIANDKHTVSLGDGTPHSFKLGEPYCCKGIILAVDGKQYSKRSSENMVTITQFSGKKIKGTFKGKVYNEETKKTLDVTGSFETANVTTF